MKILELLGATLLLGGGFCWRKPLGPTAFALGLIFVLQVILTEIRRLNKQLKAKDNIAASIDDY